MKFCLQSKTLYLNDEPSEQIYGHDAGVNFILINGYVFVYNSKNRSAKYKNIRLW